MFLIKRHDLRPNLEAQLFMPDGTTPLSLATATAVNFVMREKGADPADPPVIKRACTIVDAALGKILHDWLSGDTDVDGLYEYEFEVVWPAGEPQTIPVDSYFDLSIVRDLG